MSKGVKQFKGALSCFAKDIIKQFKEQTFIYRWRQTWLHC
jgi:hypothetical protein